MNKYLYIIITGIVLISTGSAAQTVTTYYVSSSSGNDSGTGTAGSPFKTLQKCVDSWDDTTQVICNCAGTFHEEVVIRRGGPDPSHRSKLIAWDTDGDGSRDDETFVLDGQGSYNVAIEAPQGPRPDNVEIGWLTIRNYEPEGGCSSGSEVNGIKLTCIGGNGCSDWWLHDNVFEKIGKYCNTSANKIVIQPQHAPHLLVERNRFDSSGAYIMRYIQGDGITFRNNYVHMVAAGIEAWGSPDSLTIMDNIFESDGNSRNDPSDPSCMGPVAIAFTSNVQHGLIKNNSFINCASSIKIGVSEEKGVRDNAFHIIEGNYIYRTDTVCDELNSPIIISDCSDTSNSGDTIVVHDIIIRNNVIRYSGNRTSHRGAAITLVAGHPYQFNSNIKILNNTVHGFKWGIRADECTSSGVPRPYQLKGVEIRNNIFSGIWGAFYSLERFGPWTNGTTPTDWVSDNNVLDSIDKIEWNTDYTLAQWQASKGQDVSSIQAPPMFVAGDSTLRLTSTDTVAQNRGKSLADVMQDFSKRSRPMGGAWDVGAHEVVDKRIYFASASTGDDNKLGTADQPFRTIQRGLDLWNGTEQFELRGAGSFNEEAVVRYGGLSADSMNVILPWDTDNDGSLDDETFAFDGENNHAVALSTDSLTSADYVELRNLSFRNYAPASCAQGEEARFVRLLGNDQDSVEGWSIHDNTFSNLATACDLSTKQSAIRGTWVKNLRVERNHFDSISGYLLNGIRGGSVDFRDNVAALIGGGVRTSYSVDSLRIVGNRFVGDGNGSNGSGDACRQQWGVNLINGVQYSLIAANEFIGTSGGIRFGINESGDRNNAHHIVEKNLIYLNDAACNAKRPGIVLADCSGVSAGGDSLWIEDVLIRNNVIVFDGEADSSNGGIKLASGHPYSYENNWRIYNNTIAGFKRGVVVQASEEEDGSPSEYLLNGVQVKNNLFSDISDAHYKFEGGIWESSLPSGWTSDYNVYGGVDGFRWKGKKSLAKWRTKTGEDAHSVICTASFVANDSLYHLSSTDNCGTDAGVSLSEVTDDIDGESRPSGGSYDVGADERVGGGLARLIARWDESGEEEGGERIVIYPHPVTDRGTIRVVVPEGWKDVRAIVYDGASRQVANLMFESASEPGEYELEWSTEGLASGIYLVVVESGEERIVEQVIVEKKN